MKDIGLKIVFAFIAITLNSVAYAGLFSRSCDLKEPIEKWNFCEGRAKYGDGVYEGSWKDGKPDGEGILEISIETNFEGTFKEGKPVFGCEGINNKSTITLNFKDSFKEELTTNKKNTFRTLLILKKLKK